ncbi:MAG: hypothetical protein Q8L39_13665 [Burkholderiales bacterium]|nr:hypothetical protein [Burkholderiales bacterium]
MPYYVYKIDNYPVRQLALLETFDSFKEASTAAKERRNAMPLTNGQVVKVMFAESELEAEDMLSQVRIAPPTTGEDY